MSDDHQPCKSLIAVDVSMSDEMREAIDYAWTHSLRYNNTYSKLLVCNIKLGIFADTYLQAISSDHSKMLKDLSIEINNAVEEMGEVYQDLNGDIIRYHGLILKRADALLDYLRNQQEG